MKTSRLRQVTLIAIYCFGIVVFSIINGAFVVGASFDSSAASAPPPSEWDDELTFTNFDLTSPAYEREALRLIIEEANKIAKELKLPEKLPITESDLTQAYILGYGRTFLHHGAIGNVQARDYAYFVTQDRKLSYIEGAHQDRDCFQWVDQYQWPISRIDTNGAFNLATQWLATASMDVKSLNKQCIMRSRLSSFWNATTKKGFFVPIYDVDWITPRNQVEERGPAASVSLFLPTKTLISLRVEDSKYILRPPLAFTNLDYLLGRTRTNAPTIK